jgi:hypothetical protein
MLLELNKYGTRILHYINKGSYFHISLPKLIVVFDTDFES